MAITVVASDAGAALAQPAASDIGVISGVVRLATPDTDLGPVAVQLITLREDADPEAVDQIADSDGRFEFEAEPDPLLTYIVRVRYEEVQYFSNPLLLSPELPTGTADFEVYATTSTAPELSIEAINVTLLAVDRERAELTLIREDLVRHDEPVIYTGDDDGVVLRLPVPDSTLDAGGFDDAEARYVLDGGIVSVATPLRPGVTSVVTRYTVRYEADEDEYRLRITSPLPAEHIEIRVPQRFLREVSPQGDEATRGEDDEFEGEPLTVIERTSPAGPGQGLVADLIGLSGIERATHPLTSGTGAAVGALLALIVVGAGAVALRRRAEPSG